MLAWVGHMCMCHMRSSSLLFRSRPANQQATILLGMDAKTTAAV